jgi:hypothetical protein
LTIWGDSDDGVSLTTMGRGKGVNQEGIEPDETDQDNEAIERNKRVHRRYLPDNMIDEFSCTKKCLATIINETFMHRQMVPRYRYA